MKKNRGKRRRLNDRRGSEEIKTSSITTNELPNSNDTISHATLLEFQQKIILTTKEIQDSSNKLIETVTNLFSNLTTAIIKENEKIREHVMELSCSTKESNHKSKAELAVIIGEHNQKLMTSIVEKINETISSLTKATKVTPENEESNSQVDKTKKIKEIQKKRLMERKFNYWKYYRAKSLYDIYSRELNNEKPRMPRKLRPVKIINEPEKESNTREKLAIEKLKTETELLFLRSERFKENFKHIDRSMDNLVSSQNLSEPVKSELIANWKNECKSEEEKSKYIFEKKRTWIENNLTTELRGKNGNKNKKTANNDFENALKPKRKPRWGKNWKSKEIRSVKSRINNSESFNLRLKNIENGTRHLEDDLTSLSNDRINLE